ncbi:hypothetical protein KAR91_24745 [Candidatus Pacearchaeota archaeon]|nr:hypothetical protein [Candidatus Pacearchaeota archaeon]
MNEPQNTFTAFINPLYPYLTRRAIAGDIIRFILKRASRKKGTSGRFKDYEKTYAERDEFKRHRKQIKNPNVRLTGNMLDDLKILDVKFSGKVVVGFKKNTFSNNKSVWIREKGFNFLGLSQKELLSITSNYPLLGAQDIIAQQVAAQRKEEESEEND